jgi:hypothetical protein
MPDPEANAAGERPLPVCGNGEAGLGLQLLGFAEDSAINIQNPAWFSAARQTLFLSFFNFPGFYCLFRATAS